MPEIKIETGHEITAWWDKERDLVIIKVRLWPEGHAKRGALIVLPDTLPVVPPGEQYPQLDADWHTGVLSELGQLAAQLERFGDGVEVANTVLNKIALISRVVGEIKDKVSNDEASSAE